MTSTDSVSNLYFFRFYSGAAKIVKEERSRKITLGGRGHGQLKEATIKKLSEYYKKAIYSNKGNIKVGKTYIIHLSISLFFFVFTAAK